MECREKEMGENYMVGCAEAYFNGECRWPNLLNNCRVDGVSVGLNVSVLCM